MLLFAFLTVAVPAEARTIAIVPFGEAAKELEAPLRAAFARVEGVRLSDPTSTATDVQAAKQVGLACGPQSDECLVKLALFLHVEQLVSVGATRTAEGLSVEMMLYDAALGRRSAETRFTVTGKQRARQIEDGVLMLLAPDLHFGVLELSVMPAAARVSVDGEAVAPGALRLRAGTHEVSVAHEGYLEKEAIVEVKAATTLPLSIALEPAPQAPSEPPEASWFLPGVITAGAGAAVLVGGVTTALIIDAQLRSEGVISGAQARSDALAAERVAAGVAAVGGAAALVGGAMMFVSD